MVAAVKGPCIPPLERAETVRHGLLVQALSRGAILSGAVESAVAADQGSRRLRTGEVCCIAVAQAQDSDDYPNVEPQIKLRPSSKMRC